MKPPALRILVVVRLLACLCVASSLLAGELIDRGNFLEKDDPRGNPLRLLRVIPLADGSRFVLSRSPEHEPHAMVGTLFDRAGQRTDFRASECLSASLVKPKTAGQIFGATILDDGRLALSIGWTNRKDRNINGIAVLESSDGAWRPQRIIVMRGSVRDIVAGPEGSIAAVTTDFGKRTGERLLELLLIEPDGRIRSRLETRQVASDEAEQQALGTRLQRFSEESIVFFDVSGGVMFLLNIRPTGVCEASVRLDRDRGLAYPNYGFGNCDTVETARMLSLSALPPEAEDLRNLTIDAVRLHANGALTVARHGFDGNTTRLVVTTHGQNAQTIAVPDVSAKSAVITEEYAEAVVMDSPTPHRVRLRVKQF